MRFARFSSNGTLREKVIVADDAGLDAESGAAWLTKQTGHNGWEYYERSGPQSLRALCIKKQLATIDAESVRPLRAMAAGAETQDDLDRLTALEAEAQALRAELD